MSIPEAELSKTWVCGHYFSGVAGSNPAGGIVVSFSLVLYIVRERYLRRTDHSSRGDLSNVVFCTGSDRGTFTVRMPRPLGAVQP